MTPRALAAAAVLAAALTVAIFSGCGREDSLTRAVRALDDRSIEARLSGDFAHRPFRRGGKRSTRDLGRLRDAVSNLEKQQQGEGRPETARRTAVAYLLAGRSERAWEIFGELLRSSMKRSSMLAAIRASNDPDLLVDFSAAALERSSDRSALLLALEASDRAWQLRRSAAAAWNLALAAERFGAPDAAARAWRDAAAHEQSPDWRREAQQREAIARAAIRPSAPAAEIFYNRDLPSRTASGAASADLLPRDKLASDTARVLSALSPREHMRVRTALAANGRGLAAFAEDRIGEARESFAAAERELATLGIPLALLSRDQRIRAECVLDSPRCLEEIRAFRSEVSATGRYPWLAARAAYADGQTLFRRGRIYEAAETMERALAEFRTIGDRASEGLTHSVLANTYAMAGETDTALDHHVAAVRLRFTYLGDRRRIELEDAMLFLLRHGYVAAPELLLDELAASPETEGARAMETMIRGVIAVRRGNRAAGAQQFQLAHQRIAGMDQGSVRAEVHRSVLLAEAGCGLISSNARLDDIPADRAQEASIWLPQVLTERGAAVEASDPARAESDYARAMALLETREPRIDESILTLGAGAPRESPFDRAIRLYLRQGRVVQALTIAQRAAALRISSLHARTSDVRDVFATENGAFDAANLRQSLPEGHAAVAQHVLRDELVTWVIARDAVTVARRPVVRDVLLDAADRLHRCARSEGCTVRADVEQLSPLLLRDWIERVPRGTTLWLQPAPELLSVPFAMLTTSGGEVLLERNPFTFGPQLQSLLRAQRSDRERVAPLAAFFAAAASPRGDLDPLPMATREVARAARLYQKVSQDLDARRDGFFEKAGSHAITHFAGHVLVNDQRPLLSALVFNDELLYIHEFDHDALRRVRLVVLSGCDTGRTPRPSMSVANALLSQGVPSVVSTLWPVRDEAAAAFAVAFHRELAAGKSRAAALQLAALSLRRSSPARPDVWAAFALAGAPGPIQ